MAKIKCDKTEFKIRYNKHRKYSPNKQVNPDFLNIFWNLEIQHRFHKGSPNNLYPERNQSNSSY